jgi:23S rRNA pseudouridine2457 synthase
MKKKYIVLHKPYGVLSQFTSEDIHRNLSEFCLPKGVYAAGRLDKDSEGLLLLTNDGPFINEFLKDHPRTYIAQVEGIPEESDLIKLRGGVMLNDGITKSCKARLLPLDFELPPRDPPIRERKSIPTSWIKLSLNEGRNRQVRRMTAAIGFPTLRLIRVGLGDYFINPIDGLHPGKWIEVSKKVFTSK